MLKFRKKRQEEVVSERVSFTDAPFRDFGISLEELRRTWLDLVEYLVRNRSLSYMEVAKMLAVRRSKRFSEKLPENIKPIRTEVGDIFGPILISEGGESYHYLPIADVVVPKNEYLRVYQQTAQREAEELGEISGFVYERIIKEFKGKPITDVFVDAERDAYVVSYKELGGGKRHYITVSYDQGRRIIEHLKVKASKYSEVLTTVSDAPQSGKIFYSELDLEIRIEFIPTPLGEGASLRFLDVRGYFSTTLDELGYSEEVRQVLKEISKKAQGMVLVGGPTGSGKSTMIKAVLLEVDPHKKVIRAVEDPVEVIVRGVSHVQVNPQTSFADAIRSFMRANPDVIFVGEIRDTETAVRFLEASMTGHLAFSTIHANNTIENIQRLLLKVLEGGVYKEREVYKIIAGNLLASISTRLVKRKDGKGVVPLVEIFVPDYEDRRLLEEGDFLSLTERLKDKKKDLYSEGMKLVEQGIIDREEVEKYLIF
jgi:type II secretory ATPase GspE/PulE/Tfp pilus assembly ATPase PilB-like protein